MSTNDPRFSKETEWVIKMIAESEEMIIPAKDFMLESLPSLLNTHMGRKQISTDVLFERAGLNRSFGYRILKGERRPSRDALICIAFELKLTYEETQYMLKVARYAPLTPRDGRDAVMLYGILHKKGLAETNDLLIEYDYASLIEDPN